LSLAELQSALQQCHDCPQMTGPPVHGEPLASAVLLLGQAPGTREIEQGRPFCWTAGKTLFRWFKTEPGRTLLHEASAVIAVHPAWRELVEQRRSG
jgi:uracil-DNA glycosylase